MEIEEENFDQSNETQEEIPLCLNCLRPVDPLYHYCRHCGQATGQLTPYIPFVNIPFQVDFWKKLWDQLFSIEISFTGKLFRLFMIIYNVPFVLIGIIPKLWHYNDANNDNNTNQKDLAK